MKIQELTEPKLKSDMPHLYLDMDGVQADFFGSWAKKHHIYLGKSVPHPKDAIEELAHSSAEKVYDFFRNLEPLTGGKYIVEWLKQNKVPFTVLSAPLRGPHSADSILAKKDWLDEYNPGTSGNAIFTSAKYKYALNNGKVNVLVDDYGKYLDAWKSAGGIAVKHEDENTENTIKMLEKIYGPYLNK